MRVCLRKWTSRKLAWQVNVEDAKDTTFEALISAIRALVLAISVRVPSISRRTRAISSRVATKSILASMWAMRSLSVPASRSWLWTWADSLRSIVVLPVPITAGDWLGGCVETW